MKEINFYITLTNLSPCFGESIERLEDDLRDFLKGKGYIGTIESSGTGNTTQIE